MMSCEVHILTVGSDPTGTGKLVTGNQKKSAEYKQRLNELVKTRRITCILYGVLSS